MRTNARHPQPTSPHPATTLEQAARRMRRFMCGLHGHDSLLHFDGPHVSLVCVACGHESPGWSLGGPAQPGAAGERLALVRERQIA